MHEASARTVRSRAMLVGALVAAVVAIAAALAATASGRSTGPTISVAIVANPQMQDIAALTPQLFTAQDRHQRQVHDPRRGQAARGHHPRRRRRRQGSSTSVMIGMYEAPQFGSDGLLGRPHAEAKADAAYNVNDLIPAVRDGLSANGKLYASPFYAESSFLMYRKDVLAKAGVDDADAARRGIRWPRSRRKINTPDMAGICLRGKPGWGDLGASFTTVLNTFGGTWWSSTPDGKPARRRSTSPRSRTALEFYVEPRAATPARRTRPTRASTSASPSTRPARSRCGTTPRSPPDCSRPHDSPVKGKNGYALAPVDEDECVRLAVELGARDPEELDRTRPMPGSTSPGRPDRSTSRTRGRMTKGGWAAIPPGTRCSTYEIPQYQEAAAAFAAIRRSPPCRPRRSTTPARPSGPGCPACSTSASRSSRTSATAARSCSRASSPARSKRRPPRSASASRSQPQAIQSVTRS